MTGATANLHPDLLGLLTQLEVHMGFELHVDSGYRDPEHNKDVGGVSDSEHIEDPAEGVDVFCQRSTTRYKMKKWLYANGVARIGGGNKFIHIGISKTLPQEVEWDYYPEEK